MMSVMFFLLDIYSLFYLTSELPIPYLEKLKAPSIKVVQLHSIKEEFTKITRSKDASKYMSLTIISLQNAH